MPLLDYPAYPLPVTSYSYVYSLRLFFSFFVCLCRVCPILVSVLTNGQREYVPFFNQCTVLYVFPFYSPSILFHIYFIHFSNVIPMLCLSSASSFCLNCLFCFVLFDSFIDCHFFAFVFYYITYIVYCLISCFQIYPTPYQLYIV